MMDRSQATSLLLVPTLSVGIHRRQYRNNDTLTLLTPHSSRFYPNELRNHHRPHRHHRPLHVPSVRLGRPRRRLSGLVANADRFLLNIKPSGLKSAATPCSSSRPYQPSGCSTGVGMPLRNSPKPPPFKSMKPAPGYSCGCFSGRLMAKGRPLWLFIMSLHLEVLS